MSQKEKAGEKTQNSKEELDRELRRRQLKLQFLVTREEFLAVWPMLQGASKNLAAVAGLAFAGSLTFLGLNSPTSLNDTVSLKISWTLLAASVVAHLFVFVAGLDSYINHVRTKTYSDSSRKLIGSKKTDLIVNGLREGIRAHWYQKVFFRSSKYLAAAITIQGVSLIAGGISMAIFISSNI